MSGNRLALISGTILIVGAWMNDEGFLNAYPFTQFVVGAMALFGLVGGLMWRFFPLDSI